MAENGYIGGIAISVYARTKESNIDVVVNVGFQPKRVLTESLSQSAFISGSVMVSVSHGYHHTEYMCNCTFLVFI